MLAAFMGNNSKAPERFRRWQRGLRIFYLATSRSRSNRALEADVIEDIYYSYADSVL